MPEDTEEQEPKPLDLQRYLDVARRRYPYFLISLLLGWLLVWGASWILPARYDSSTLILVEQPAMPKDYVVSNINEDVQNRLENITQQILSRTRLLQIIRRLNLYGEDGGQPMLDERVARMRKDIDVKLVRDPGDTKITSFTIDYSARDPHVAQRVTAELANLFINENVEVRQQQSEDTTKFLQGQLADASQSLAAQAQKIQQFQAAHMGELPSQQASNLQILAGLQSQLESEQNAMSTAQQQRVYLQSLISQYRNLPGPSGTAGGSSTGLAAIDRQLEQLRGQLADLSSRYTDQYPDVQKVKMQIAQTEKMRAAFIAGLKNESNTQNELNTVTEDPAQSATLMQLQGQLRANRTEITNRGLAIANLKARVGEYQTRLNAEPTREQQFTDLTRGYDQSKANYDSLLKKESESAMATSMEQMQKGQRFRVLDPPSLPLKPAFPNRLKFCGAGLGFGLALGVVVAGSLEFMDDRMHSEEEIKLLLPVKVISEIPEILNSSDERKAKRSAALGWAISVFVAAVILAGSVLSVLHG